MTGIWSYKERKRNKQDILSKIKQMGLDKRESSKIFLKVLKKSMASNDTNILQNEWEEDTG